MADYTQRPKYKKRHESSDPRDWKLVDLKTALLEKRISAKVPKDMASANTETQRLHLIARYNHPNSATAYPILEVESKQRDGGAAMLVVDNTDDTAGAAQHQQQQMDAHRQAAAADGASASRGRGRPAGNTLASSRAGDVSPAAAARSMTLGNKGHLSPLGNLHMRGLDVGRTGEASSTSVRAGQYRIASVQTTVVSTIVYTDGTKQHIVSHHSASEDGAAGAAGAGGGGVPVAAAVPSTFSEKIKPALRDHIVSFLGSVQRKSPGKNSRKHEVYTSPDDMMKGLKSPKRRKYPTPKDDDEAVGNLHEIR